MATAPADSWHVGMQFKSMKEARDALVRHTLDLHASFRVEKANSEKYFTACRSGSDCPYKVRMYTSRKTGLVRIQTYEPLHTCSSDTHDNWRPPVPTAPEAEGSSPMQPKSAERVRNGSIDISATYPTQKEINKRESESENKSIPIRQSYCGGGMPRLCIWAIDDASIEQFWAIDANSIPYVFAE